MGLSAKDVARILGGQELNEFINYTPYDFSKVTISVGVPPMPIIGLDYVSARFINPRKKRFQCLTGRGVFASNTNTAGVIEFGILGGSLSQGVVEIIELTGIPYPIIINDSTTGGTSSVVASACQQVSTPEWKRGAVPGLTIYTFETTRMFINHGLRLPLIVT